MNSKSNGILWIMLVIMLFFPIFYSMGVSVIILEVLLILLSCIYLSNIQRLKIGRIVPLFVLLVLIDKTNDLIYDFSLTNLGPIVYASCVALVFNNIEGKFESSFLTNLKWLLFIAVVLNIAFCLINNTAPLRSLDRDVSAMLMLFSLLNFYYGKHRWIILLVSMFICVMVLEARTMILSYGVFIAGFFVFNRYNNQKLKKLVLFAEFLFALLVIFIGIQTEMILGPGNNETGLDFSGRGYLWGAALTSFASGSIGELLFGMPSNPENLRALFGYDMFEYDSLNESVGSLLVSGHFHNTVVYYIFNTGIIGTILLFSLFYKSLKRFGFNNENYNIFNAVFLVTLFNGKSITSIYILSTLFMIILFIKLPHPSYSVIKPRKRNYDS